jgi:predicted outer membrane repeat protein
MQVGGNGWDAIAADAHARVLVVGANATVVLGGLAVTGGKSAGDGGGIVNRGTLTLEKDCIVRGNSCTERGGGIYNAGTLTLARGSTVRDTTAVLTGGGIDTAPFGSMP